MKAKKVTTLKSGTDYNLQIIINVAFKKYFWFYIFKRTRNHWFYPNRKAEVK